MKKFIQFFIPPENWRFPVLLITGIFTGLVIFTFYISKAWSYLSDDPATCVNCHIMAPEYATWFHSSHGRSTTCNDCHVPHDNFVNHYLFKAQDGMRHATIFTLGLEPQVIHIKEAGTAVVQENCKRCHGILNKEVATINVTYKNSQHGEGKLCWECHREVPHGRVKSLSSVPFANAPLPESPVPDWLKKMVRE